MSNRDDYFVCLARIWAKYHRGRKAMYMAMSMKKRDEHIAALRKTFGEDRTWPHAWTGVRQTVAQ